MPTYVEQTGNSDLSPTWPNTTAFDKEMSTGAGGDGSVVVSLSSSEVQSGGFITPAGVPNNDAWESGGTFTVELEVDVTNHQVTGRCRIVRLDSAGNILQSGAFDPATPAALTENQSWSPVAPTWTGGEEDCDNRLAIEVEFTENQGMANSVTIGLGTTANEVVTDVSEDVGACVPTPDFGWFVQPSEPVRVTKPRQQGLFAAPPAEHESIIPVFDWNVQEPDVVRLKHQTRSGLSVLVDFSVPTAEPDFGWFVQGSDIVRRKSQTRPGLFSVSREPIIAPVPDFGWFVLSATPIIRSTRPTGFFVLVELVAVVPPPPAVEQERVVIAHTDVIIRPNRIIGY